MPKMDIAVVGAGVAGLGAAWLLAKSHNVTLYDQNDYFGGHANTKEVFCDGETIPVDTGFIVYNEPNYPNLRSLFAHLGVKTEPAEMTFALTLDNARLEYSGTGLTGYFGQWQNLFRAGHWQLLGEINRFFRTALTRVATYSEETTLGEFLKAEGYSSALIDEHIVPMGAAIWSSSMVEMMAFPANAFITFYANHAMMSFTGRGVWRTVAGGSREYVRKMLDDVDMTLRSGTPVKTIIRRPDSVHIEDESGIVRRHDHVVIAAHANEALKLLSAPDALEQAYLSRFRYQHNRAVLHRDPRWMPRRRRLWSAWNYVKREEGPEAGLCVTYWMNELQNLPTKTDLFVTLNPPTEIHPKAVDMVIDYEHPVFDHEATSAQAKLWALQGRQNTWFCGAYFGYGFHEDGLQSGLAVAEALGGVSRPWEVPNKNGRIAPLRTEESRHTFMAAE